MTRPIRRTTALRRRGGSSLRTALCIAALAPFACAAGSAQPADSIQYVVHVSVDGLRPDAVVDLGPANCPHLYRMRVTGAYTDNARTDFDYTVTLPDHVCQLTARPVNGVDGHGVSFNEDNGGTLESVHGSYVAGVFDVVHDRGLRTAMYVGKSKFAFLERSWNATNGAPDVIGEDDGRDKIDRYLYLSNTAALVDSFLAAMAAQPIHYAFIHLKDPDAVGHASGWCSGPYYDCVIDMDGRIGRIFDLIDGDPALSGRTAVIVTSDHGGEGFDHGNPALPHNYTVPLAVWRPDIPAGADLYLRNVASRLDPGGGRPDQQAAPQPIRNGDASNLGLDLLGLPPIPGSVINAAQDLAVGAPAGAGIPEVSITAPEDGGLFDLFVSIRIEVQASVDGDSIAGVEFFADYEMIGEDGTAPYSFTWSDVPLGRYTITARARSGAGLCSVSSVEIEVVGATPVEGDGRPAEAVTRIFPHPSDRSAVIEFLLIEEARVEMAVYDILGRRLGVLFDRRFNAGRHRQTIATGDLSPGIYLYRLIVTRENISRDEGGRTAQSAAPRTATAVSAGKLLILR